MKAFLKKKIQEKREERKTRREERRRLQAIEREAYLKESAKQAGLIGKKLAKKRAQQRLQGRGGGGSRLISAVTRIGEGVLEASKNVASHDFLGSSEFMGPPKTKRKITRKSTKKTTKAASGKTIIVDGVTITIPKKAKKRSAAKKTKKNPIWL